MGTGSTLTRAFRFINLDADWEEQWNIQADGRVVPDIPEVVGAANRLLALRRVFVTPPGTGEVDKQPNLESLREETKKVDRLLTTHQRVDNRIGFTEAAKQGKPKPAPSTMTYLIKAHKIRAATVIPNIFAFVSQHGLKLTDDESRDDIKTKRRKYRELEGKESNWVKYPEDSIYYTHLEYLSKLAPKLLALEGLIQSLGQNIYGRPEKLVIFTSCP
ncbi:MAG: hypothetical protein Q9175_002491 [Cornicularia normoerica]